MINGVIVLFAPLVSYSTTTIAIKTETVSTLRYSNGGVSGDDCNRDEQITECDVLVASLMN